MTAARSTQKSAERPAPPPPSRLYPVLEVTSRTADLLTAALARVPLATVLLAPPAGTPLRAETVRPLVEIAQKRHCAILLLDNAALARTLRADGVHLSAGSDLMARFEEARSILGGGAIVGVDAGASRHLAMELGEAGADYIAFSEQTAASPVAAPATTEADTDALETVPGPTARDDLVAWWAEVFEVPCVAVVEPDPAIVADLAAAGADFIACRITAGAGVIADDVARLIALHDSAEGVDATTI